MNWKFWTWGAEARRLDGLNVRELEARNEGLQHAVKSHQKMIQMRAWEIERLQGALRFKARPERDKPTEQQMFSALAVVDESTPLWRAVHRLIDWLEEDQKTAVCLANTNDAQRHYNAGRLAMCEDLRDQLLQKWAEAQRQNHEAQRPE